MHLHAVAEKRKYKVNELSCMRSKPAIKATDILNPVFYNIQ